MRKALLRGLAVFVEGIAGKSAREDAKLGADLAGHVVTVEASLGLDWRLQQSLLLALPPLSQVSLYIPRVSIPFPCKVSDAVTARECRPPELH